jgi:mannose-1-phosphate guanylyltransferase
LDSINIGVKSENPIVTFGIKPIYPETGFGYINVDMADMFVNKFIEKPSLEKATILISEENNYWNSGIYLLESNNFYELVNEDNTAMYTKTPLGESITPFWYD